ncbi:MAG: cytochrome c-type biogenesis protein CcmH [Hyphomicrobiales bacterium]|nr:cytochrome c-type biogenesis protein CcmH [Hyphomicrobiales bacterium]MCP5371854.1 cytochrome c-type biogenesis protein CcmH [Hyphomicrobiales bacterium]
MRRIAVLLLLALALWAPAAGAVEPAEKLADPALESRAREISQVLRCVVCQNQSIDDSNAELAHDMRLLVRERLVKGESNQQVIDYMVSRYGDFVLLKPPVKAKTYALWFGPLALFLIAVAVAVVFVRRRAAATAAAPAPLSDDERRRLDELMKGGDR